MLKNVILILLLLSFSSSIGNEKNDNYQELRKDLSYILKNSDLDNAQIGMQLFSLKNKYTIFDYNSEKNYVPASVVKLITTAAAMEYLSGDYIYSTKLYLDGVLNENGEFEGNIIIRGYGDPTLSHLFYDNPGEIFDEWCYKLDSLGIKSIKGNIIGDDNFFDDVFYPSGWLWEDIKFGYSAQVGALSFENNTLDVSIISGDTPNSLAYITLEPETDYVRIVNNIKTKREITYPDINFEKEGMNNFYEFFGPIPFDPNKKDTITEDISIDNPTLFFLNNFADHLRDFNIRFKGALLDIDDWNERPVYFKLKELTTKKSDSLKNIIKVINKQSINVLAETLLKTIAKEKGGDGSFSDGIKFIEQFVNKFYTNYNYSLVDGSGLSRLNFISPELMIDLLRFIYNSPYKETFIKSLATPAEENSTLERRLYEIKNKSILFAKTGSMNGISNISGYIFKEDDILCFSIMFNNFSITVNEANNIQDLIIMRIINEK